MFCTSIKQVQILKPIGSWIKFRYQCLNDGKNLNVEKVYSYKIILVYKLNNDDIDQKSNFLSKC